MSAMRSLARAAAVGRLEAKRALLAQGTARGVAIFAVAHAVGRWQGAGSDGLFVLGFLAGYTLAFSPGLSADRGLSFDRLMVLNLVSPWDYAAGKAWAMLAWTAGFAAFCWAVAAAVPGGGLRFAGWFGALAFLMALTALPAVVATDLLLGTRLPGAVALILACVALVVALALGADPPEVLSALGLLVTPYSYASLVPLLLRSCVGLAVAPVLVALGAAVRGWGAPGRLPGR
jgi:hypothetical protein